MPDAPLTDDASTEPEEQMSPTVAAAAAAAAADYAEPEPESRTFTAPEGTEIATVVGDTGERVEITFPYTTSDEAVIELLAAMASDPDHPVQEG